MGSYREGKNIWWRLFGFWPNGEWRGWDVFSKRWWKYREYVFHDSIGKFWNHWIKCKIIGHNNVKNVADPGKGVIWHCFDCEHRVGYYFKRG